VRRVIITGFMAAGKTTVGLALARLLGAAFVDLDDAVRELEGRGPRELIDAQGEEYFRDAETRALGRVLEENAAHVIATGGGAWTFERNRALTASHGCLSVWLDAPFDLCLQRIDAAGGPADRPAAYRLADLRVLVTPQTSVGELAARIAAALDARA
jgi:shikimate kinase